MGQVEGKIAIVTGGAFNVEHHTAPAVSRQS
jgi:hypothetical protein